MSNTEVLLLKSVEGIGDEGDLVKVKAGYARNYLLPHKIALPITQVNKKHVASLVLSKEKRLEKEKEASIVLSEKIEKLNLKIFVKVGDNGKMFGAVTSSNIVEKLKEENIDIDKKHINISNPIKETGMHKINIKVAKNITTELKLEIASEDLSKKEDVVTEDEN